MTAMRRPLVLCHLMAVRILRVRQSRWLATQALLPKLVTRLAAGAQHNLLQVLHVQVLPVLQLARSR